MLDLTAMIVPVPTDHEQDAADADLLDTDDETQVIFRLTVQAERPLEGLADLRVFENRKGRLPDDEVFYDVAHASFEDGDWNSRADKLDAAVRHALDRLEASGVDPQDLRRPDVFVRAFFTFGPGAETLSADIIERLAMYHATVWIDA
jgi:hypothetical protein